MGNDTEVGSKKKEIEISGDHIDTENSKVRILAIDDEKINLKLLDKMLRANGYCNIELIQNPEQAIDAYHQHPADLILLDLQMPRKDGFTLLDEFHSLNDPLLPPIVVLTAYQQREYRLKALQLGARDFLTKPFDQIELIARIRNLIEMQKHLKVVRQQKDILEQENSLAQNLHENLLGDNGHNLPGVSCFHLPASVFSGDLFLARTCPHHQRLYIVLADAMGHGLTAAISLIPLSMLFHSMVDQGRDIEEIATELNALLYKLLPDDRFVAATLLQFDLNARTVQVWNGGLPPVLCISPQNKNCIQFNSLNMSLGILSPKSFKAECVSHSLLDGDKMMLYSDGVTEALNEQNEYFNTRLNDMLNSLCETKFPMQLVRTTLEQHIIHTEPKDDICLAEIDIQHVVLENIHL
ncbi:SpoIIE family protein phosphatase [Colwelliaceae bacterium 6471]